MWAQLQAVKQARAHWSGGCQDDMLVGDQVRLFSALQNAGDSSINHDYADWIRHLSVPDNPSRTPITGVVRAFSSR